MPGKRSDLRLTKTAVQALRPRAERWIAWDAQLRGFGCRVHPDGRKVFIVGYRGADGAQRKMTIGEFGVLTAEQARERAGRILSEVKLGGDPQGARSAHRRSPTVADVIERFLREEGHRYQPSTLKSMGEKLRNHVVPEFGRLKIGDLTRARVKAWHGAKAQHAPYQANRCLAYLSAVMRTAVREWELLPENPCHGISKPSEAHRERFFADDEIRRIAGALTDLATDDPCRSAAALAVRLLALTGARVGEVLALRWEHVRLADGYFELPRHKTVRHLGKREVLLPAPAQALLADLAHTEGFVVSPDGGKTALTYDQVHNFWRRVRDKAQLADARLHDFRHSMATYAASTGANAFLVRDLLGHKTIAMAARYVERERDPLRHVVRRFGDRMSAAMGGRAAKPKGKESRKHA